MKNLVIIVMMFIGLTSFSQNKNAKATIEVDGVCGMCKARIEKACVSTKGVKFAEWNVETHQLKLIFDEGKTDLKKIKTNIAAAGHDTKDIKASDEAYNKISSCCKYRDQQVVDNHK